MKFTQKFTSHSDYSFACNMLPRLSLKSKTNITMGKLSGVSIVNN